MHSMKTNSSEIRGARDLRRRSTAARLYGSITGAVCQARRFRRDENGQALVLCALGVVVLLLATGIAVDVGYLLYQKQQMQRAADAGAIGAGMALSIYGSGQSQITTAGQYDSAANGFSNNSSGITVAVNNPPVDGPYSTVGNNEDYVEVTVSQTQPTFFMQVGGFYSVPVRARAVAGLRGTGGCIYVLDPTDKDSYLQSGGSVVTAGCGIMVDSSNSAAFEDTGWNPTGGTCTDAASIQIVGGYGQCSDYSGQNPCTCYGATSYPGPVTGIQPFADPLANRTQPTVASCANYSTLNLNGGTVSQGQYCGGMSLSGTVTMNPGVYIMAGGGFTINGTATVTGTGVTIFNTGTNGGPGGYKGISINGGNTNAILSAPTSGPTEGILFWEDRNIPWNNLGSSQTSQITGGSNTSLIGALYFPTTSLTYSGGSSLTAYTDIVAYQLNITGNSTINDNTTSTYGAPAINTAALVQ